MDQPNKLFVRYKNRLKIKYNILMEVQFNIIKNNFSVKINYCLKFK